MRKRHFTLAGAALGYAALLRLFPALMWLGPAAVAGAQLLRQRRLSQEYRRLFWGGAISVGVLLPCSWAATGPGAYREFAQRISTHAATPISNHMSLKTLFSVSPEAPLRQAVDQRLVDPVEPWKQARRERLHQLRWWYRLTAATLTAFFLLTVRRLRRPWLAVALSLSAVVLVTDPSCYYYSMWVLAAVLCRARRSLELLLVAAAGTGQVLVRHYQAFDERYVALAALYVILALLVIVMFARPPTLKSAAMV